MTKKITIIAFLSLIAILAGCQNNTVKNNQTENTSNTSITNNSNSKNLTIEGVITNVHNGCWSDGICSIEVDKKWNIAIISGGLRAPNSEPEIIGETVEIEFAEGNPSIGKKVKIFAKQIDENRLSIYGSKDYYVKVIK